MSTIPPIMLVGCGRMGSAMLTGWRERGLGPSMAIDPSPAAAVMSGPDLTVITDVGAVPAAFAPAAVVLAGCAQFDAALDQRQAIVTFTDSATLAQRLAVRAACAKTPNVTAQALPSNLNSPYAVQQVVYTVTQASDADIALLNECLNKYPTVVQGMTLQDASDEGN